MLKRRFFGIIWVIAILFALYVFIDQKIVKDYSLRVAFPEMPRSALSIEEIKREVITTTPLRATTTSKISKSQITSDMLILLTNKERQKAGLPALGNNDVLDSIALTKIQDMFSKQYFEHISPSGENAGDFAAKAGYDYFIIGENLASGGFKSAESIIEAWMASQGHRENILNPKYREMGAAALSGTFDGKATLLAVQIFGTPTSICPKPNDTSRLIIDDMEKIINEKKQTLDFLYQEINESKKNEEHNAKINEYNALVKEYNRIVDEAKNLINEYNDQVHSFTECATATAK